MHSTTITGVMAALGAVSLASPLRARDNTTCPEPAYSPDNAAHIQLGPNHWVFTQSPYRSQDNCEVDESGRSFLTEAIDEAQKHGCDDELFLPYNKNSTTLQLDVETLPELIPKPTYGDFLNLMVTLRERISPSGVSPCQRGYTDEQDADGKALATFKLAPPGATEEQLTVGDPGNQDTGDDSDDNNNGSSGQAEEPSPVQGSDVAEPSESGVPNAPQSGAMEGGPDAN